MAYANPPLVKILSPFRLIVLFVILSVIGTGLIASLRIDLVPESNASAIRVSFDLANASPMIVEQQATAVLENTFSRLGGLKKISSVSTHNQASIVLEFENGEDMEMKQFEVIQMIRRTYPLLPAETSYPQVSFGEQKQRESEEALMIFSLYGSIKSHQLQAFAEENITRSLAAVPGVKEIRLSGAASPQVVVAFDMSRCDIYHINPIQIQDAVSRLFRITRPGIFSGNQGHYMLVGSGRPPENLEAVKSVLLPGHNPAAVRLRDVADVYLEDGTESKFYRINGKNALHMQVFLRSNQNALVASAQLKDIVRRLNEGFPQGLTLSTVHDKTDYLREELNKNYRRCALSVLILLSFIFIAYRKTSYFLVLLASLIVTTCLTVIIAFSFGININLYSIAGIAIAFALVTDNLIVMLEYYRLHLNLKVFPSMLGAACTMIAALSLVRLLPEEERLLLMDFAWLIVAAVCASLVTAFGFIPAMFDWLTARGRTPQERKRVRFRRRSYLFYVGYWNFIRRLSGKRWLFVPIVVLLFGLPFFLLPAKWEGDAWYHNGYNAFFGSRKYQEEWRPVVNKWLGGGCYQFARNVSEQSGYRDPQQTRLFVEAALPAGHTLEQMNDIFVRIERMLVKTVGIDLFITSILSGQKGFMQITFKDGFDRGALPLQVKAALSRHTYEMGGVEWQIYGVGQGFSAGMEAEIPQFRILLKGYNYDMLQNEAQKISDVLQKHRRVQKVNLDELQQFSEKTRQVLSFRFGKNVTGVSNERVFAAFLRTQQLAMPVRAATVSMNGARYPLVVREKGLYSAGVQSLLSATAFPAESLPVRLGMLGATSLETISGSLYKENRQYVRVISFDYLGEQQFGEKLQREVIARLEQTLPPGFSAEKHEWIWEQQLADGRYWILGVLAVINFFICSIIFGNLRQSLAVLVMIPLSFIGLMYALAFSGFFDQGGFAAFILTGGLVANSGIFIINALNERLKGRVRPFNSLLVKTIFARSHTVFLTIISCCCGILPFLFEGSDEVFWYSFAVGTLGGLLFALAVVFVGLPLMLWKRRRPNAGRGVAAADTA